MKAMKDKWSAMIDVTNLCQHQCTYCIKSIRHLRKDQRDYMDIETFKKACDSLIGYPGKVCLTGGDPLCHPDFVELCKIMAQTFPKSKIGVFTSHEQGIKLYKELIDLTFGEVYINLHTDEQKQVCCHQPYYLAVGDMVEDKVVRQHLIENCWCGNMWSPIVSSRGCFFCDVAMGIDMALDMGGGWPIERGWWVRDDFSDQQEKYCHLCGMCLPYPTQLVSDTKEKISKGLYEKFKEKNLRNLDDMEVIDKPLTFAEIQHNLVDWQPWRNRQDKAAEGPAYTNK